MNAKEGTAGKDKEKPRQKGKGNSEGDVKNGKKHTDKGIQDSTNKFQGKIYMLY